MTQEAARTLTVAGKIRSMEDALGVFEQYPHKTPAAFDFVGPGEPGVLTAVEVIRTRKISSRISNKELPFFVETASTAPWMDASADLAEADPTNGHLFPSMTDLYWHFAERAPKGVSVAKISKVLHLKMPNLFPILDSHLARSYAPATKMLRIAYPQFGWRRRTWIAVRNDLLAARTSGALDELRGRIRGYETTDTKKSDHVQRMDHLTDLRLLDILVW